MGFRWHEVFGGMDAKRLPMINVFTRTIALLFLKITGQKMPWFAVKNCCLFSGTPLPNGQLYGNRLLGNKVNVTNPYWFSYPGYSEIMCGFVDDSYQ
jgi:hypothetical protein